MSVIVNAKRLQDFLYKYKFDDENENYVLKEILEYIPLSCNYAFNSRTLVAEVCSFSCFHACTKNLQFHLQFKFCFGCKLKIHADFYYRLSFLGKIHGILLKLDKPRARPPSVRESDCWIL